VLLPVAGRAIIDYTLEAFGQAGVTDVALVIGHQGEAVKRWVGDGAQMGLRVDYITNPDYELGNALSLSVARAYLGGEPFLLSMGDHMVSAGLLERLMETPEPGNLLAVDFTPAPRHIEEGTRVRVDPRGVITHIGKGLAPWDGIDAGAFRLSAAIFEAIDSLRGEESTQYELSGAITLMLDKGHTLHACDISGCFWQDVDTWEDLVLVREMLAGGDR
jgi:choline kinase